MATPFVENVPPPHPFDSIAVNIERRYEGIVNVVRERKFEILAQLSEFREEYDSLISNRDKTEQELKSVKKDIEGIKENDLKTMQQDFLAKIEEKMEKLRISTANYSIQFYCKSEELETKLSQLGELVKMDYERPNYSEKSTPIVAVQIRGRGKMSFNQPRGIAFDKKTQMIYVCDMGNSRILLLSLADGLIAYFGCDELYSPWGISLCEDSIYVTDWLQCAIFHFHKNTHQLIKRLGKEGSGKGEFDYPRSLALGPDGDLYVAEDNNDRISVLDRDLNFKRFIQNESIPSPFDVQFTKNNMLILSFNSPNRVHLLTLQGKYIKSIIPIESEARTWFFCLDRANNILVSIWNKNLVQVYNEERELINSIGNGRLLSPCGLTTTGSGRLFVVTDQKDNGIHIFATDKSLFD